MLNYLARDLTAINRIMARNPDRDCLGEVLTPRQVERLTVIVLAMNLWRKLRLLLRSLQPAGYPIRSTQSRHGYCNVCPGMGVISFVQETLSYPRDFILRFMRVLIRNRSLRRSHF